MGKSAPQAVRTYQLGTINYSAGGMQSLKLNKGALERFHILNLAATLTVTGANNTAANLALGDEWSALQKLEWVVNGSEVIRSMTGAELWNWNLMMFDAPPQITPTLGDGITANPVINSILYMPWMGVRGAEYRSLDTVLDTSKYADFEMRVTWQNSYTSVNSAATAWGVSPVLSLYTHQSFGVQGAFLPTLQSKLSTIFTGAQTKARINLPPGPVYKGLMVHTSNAAGTVDDSTNLSAIRLKSGSTYYFDLPAIGARKLYNDLRRFPRQFERMFGAAQAANIAAGAAYAQADLVSIKAILAGTGGGGYGRLMNSSNYSNDSWFYIDLTPDGYNTEAVNSQGLSELYVEVDVLAAMKVDILPLMVFPASAA